MFCKNCGAALPDGARFCGCCGNPVAVAEAAEEAVEQVSETVETAAEQMPEQINNDAEEIAAAVPVQEAEQATEYFAEAAESAAEETAGCAEDTAGETVLLSYAAEQAAEGYAENAAQKFDETVQNFDETAQNTEAAAENFAEGVQNAENAGFEVVSEPVYSEPEAYAQQNAQNEQYYGENAPAQNAGGYVYNVETAQAPVKPVKQKKEKTRKKAGVWAHVGAVLICILLFAFLVATIAVAAVQYSVTESTISDAISRTHIDSLRVTDLLDDSQVHDLGLNMKSESETLLDFLYENIDQSQLNKPITKDEFNEIALSDEFRDFVAMTISRRAGKVIDGIKTNVIDIDEIISFVRSQRKYLSGVMGYKITDEEIENLRGVLEDNYGEAISKLEIQPINSYVDDGAASAIKLVFAKWVLIVLIVVVVLFAVLIFLIVRSFKTGCMYNGVTFVLAGLPFLLAAAAFAIGIIKIKSELPIVQFIVLAAGAISKILLILGGSVVLAGVIMIVISCIIRSVKKKKQLKAA